MSLRRTAALAVAVALVGGFYYWYEVEGARRRQAAEERSRRLLEVEPQAVSAVGLRRAGLEMRAERREGAWHLVSPLETRADQEAVGELVRAASEAKKIRVIEEAPGDLKPFGLDPPRILVTLQTARGEARLALGSASPTGKGIYALAGSGGPVVLLEREAERAADKGLRGFRDRSLFSGAGPAEVRGLSIRRSAGPIALERAAGGAWTLTEPIQAPADPEAVEELLRALTGGEVQEFIDETEADAAAYGLGVPRASVTLSTGDGRTLGPLLIGKDAGAGAQGQGPEAGRVYARLGEGGPVWLLEAKLLEALAGDAASLREKRLLVYELADVERLEAVSPELKVAAERRGEREWVMTRPLEAAADEAAVRNLLWDVKALRAASFVDGADPSEERYGLGAPARRYLLKLKGRSEPLWLDVGGEVEGGGRRYVRSSRQGGVVTVEAEGLQKIEVTGLTLRERSLLAFETADVRRLEVTGGGRRVELARDGAAWQLTAPERRELKPGAVSSLLWSLRRLKFSGVVEEEKKEEPTGELLLEARLWTTSGGPMRVAALKPEGKEGGEPLAFGSARPGLYRVAPKDLKEVEEEIDRLLAGQ